VLSNETLKVFSHSTLDWCLSLHKENNPSKIVATLTELLLKINKKNQFVNIAENLNLKKKTELFLKNCKLIFFSCDVRLKKKLRVSDERRV